jgi:hypothetical protein
MTNIVRPIRLWRTWTWTSSDGLLRRCTRLCARGSEKKCITTRLAGREVVLREIVTVHGIRGSIAGCSRPPAGLHGT